MDPVEMILDRLAQAYQSAFASIQVAAERAAMETWYQFGSFAGEDEEAWSEALWAIVVGAATAASYTTLSYVEAQWRAEGLDVTLPEPDLDWLEDDFKVWHLSPMVAARIAVSRGATPQAAMSAAATRVTDVTTAVLRQVEQQALDTFLDSIGEIQVDVDYTEVDPTVAPKGKADKPRVRWKRVTSPGACGFCVVTADRLYSGRAQKRSPLGPWHNYCRCTWRKVTEREAAAFEPSLSGGEWKDVIERRFDPQPATAGEQA